MKPVNIAVFSTIAAILFSSLSLSAIAQDSHLSNPDAGQISFVNFDPAKDVFTMSGSRIAANEQADVNGSPYMLSYWAKGTVVFASGKVYRDGALQLNLVTNQLQFLNNGRPLVFAAEVSSFTLVDTSGGEVRTAWFNSGYPPFGMHNKNSFYQVLAIGANVHLIKFISKHISDQYQYNGPARVFYKETEDLLIYDVKAAKLHIIGLNVGSVEKALKGVSGFDIAMLSGIHNKKLTEDDITGLVNKLNQ